MIQIEAFGDSYSRKKGGLSGYMGEIGVFEGFYSSVCITFSAIEAFGDSYSTNIPKNVEPNAHPRNKL
jgi:hypothetical protein